jgi:hypothetical protein
MPPLVPDCRAESKPGISWSYPPPHGQRTPSVVAVSVGTTEDVPPQAEVRRLLSSRPLRWPDSRVVYSNSYRPSLIKWGNRTFELKRPLSCRMEYSEGMWVIECADIAARAYDRTREAAINAFAEEFAMLWDDYAQANDDQLAADALTIKHQLIEIVCKVATS